jgi:PTH1 family peptidyl-tRNA hydrolase
MAKLIIGLGNPGEKYEMSRHNLGFRVIDKIAEDFNLPKTKCESKFKAEISEGRIKNEKILFVKPQTFMNESGQAARAISCFYKITTENIWVIYDDLDLPLGKLKISFNKSSGGHKGVQSIIDQLGRKDFFRFRIGVSQKSIKSKVHKVGSESCELRNFVLGEFSPEEEKIIQEAIKKTALAIETALKENIEKAMNKINSD